MVIEEDFVRVEDEEVILRVGMGEEKRKGKVKEDGGRWSQYI